jgi:V8-like Glu-specific endopeptidase
MIIGNVDERSIEYGLDAAPHNAIALVQTLYDDHSELTGYGTAFLIGGGRLVTAGHVLWNNLDGKSVRNRLPDRIKLYVGAGLFESRPELVFEINNVGGAGHVHPNFESSGLSQWDVATIDVFPTARTLPQATLPLLTFPGRIVAGRSVTISGYPIDRSPFGAYEGLGALADTAVPIFEHQADTAPGQSGAPVRIKRDGVWQAIGIHLGDGVEGAPGASRNRALALTPEIIGWLRA